MSEMTKDYADSIIAGIREHGYGEGDEITHADCGAEAEARGDGWWYCEDCAEEFDKDDAEGIPAAWDFVNDALDWRYVIDRDGSYRSAEIAITLGGPNVWIHTGSRELHVHWAFDHEVRNLPTEFCDGLDEALEDYYEGTR